MMLECWTLIDRVEKSRDKETERMGERGKGRAQRTEILNPNSSTSAVLTNLVIPIGKNAGAQTVIKHRIVIVFFISAISITAAVTEVVFERDVGGRRASAWYVRSF